MQPDLTLITLVDRFLGNDGISGIAHGRCGMLRQPVLSTWLIIFSTFREPVWPHLRDELGYVVVAVMHGHYFPKVVTHGSVLVHGPEVYHLSFKGCQCSELSPHMRPIAFAL